jgi:tetratricopeptide (TPR) repeat protein
VATLDDPNQDHAYDTAFTPDGAQLVATTHDSYSAHVWDLRRIRAGLKEVDLDWDAPDYPPAPPVHAPLRPFQVIDVSEADKRLAQQADDALLKRLMVAVERDPENVARRWERGDWYARHGRWKEAAADYVLALERKPPDDAERWLHAAPALAAGDGPGYRRLRHAMLERFGATQDPKEAERLAKGCLVLPDADKDTEWACQLADRAATLGKDHPYANHFLYCKGLADYRRGNFAAAVAGLEPLVARHALSVDLTACCHLVLAMALHRQGQAQAGSEHLAEEAKLLRQHVGDLDRFSMERSRYSHDWPIAWLLHREAQTLIAGEKSTPSK